MPQLTKIKVAAGIFWVEAREAGVSVLCGCPADSVKHLAKAGLIVKGQADGLTCDTGPNAILLSDVRVQGGSLSNLAEFPVLQMLYMQGMLVPNHPNNTDIKPLLIGSEEQIKEQLRYIHRGNYGLLSEAELQAAGVDAATAREMMRIKLAFAFGRIRPTEELVDSLVVRHESVPVRNELTVRRLRLNVFEFAYRGETVTVDLNLGPAERYESPYPLTCRLIDRDYFAVVHSGNGDGWDMNRPAMSSILVFQGKVYLIDAEPNILNTLAALGIGVSEIDGIFHTHAHDDHFGGLTALMRSDHRIRYYATPWVRDSVVKKLAALLSMEEDRFADFFEPHDLVAGEWNDISSLGVKPSYSPHPVETSVFTFRVGWHDGVRVYAHLADTVSLGVLENMVTSDPAAPGLTQEFFEDVKRSYLAPADVKKVDIGGGLIHGRAEDFRRDVSAKVILAHTSRPLTEGEKQIGSEALFGSVDVLIRSHQDYVRGYAQAYLQAYFPSAPSHQVDALLNHPVVTVEPGVVLLRTGEATPYIHLVLTGDVEMTNPESGMRNVLSAGALVGEHAGLTSTVSEETYRAVNYVRVLQLPCSAYMEFVRHNGLYLGIRRVRAKRAFMQRTWLLGEAISYPIQNRIARAMRRRNVGAGEFVPVDGEPLVYLLKQGELQVLLDEDVVETLRPGDFVGECRALHGTASLFRFRAVGPVRLYSVPSAVLLDCPVVRWKLVECHERRMRLLLDSSVVTTPIFQWREQYSTNVAEMDAHHRELFNAANSLYRAIGSRAARAVLQDTLGFLMQYTQEHFAAEEDLLKQYGYDGYAHHCRKHRQFIDRVSEFEQRFRSGEIELDADFIGLLKFVIVSHILTEDRKYTRFLNDHGVF